jgi:hypothetical protein
MDWCLQFRQLGRSELRLHRKIISNLVDLLFFLPEYAFAFVIVIHLISMTQGIARTAKVAAHKVCHFCVRAVWGGGVSRGSLGVWVTRMCRCVAWISMERAAQVYAWRTRIPAPGMSAA